MDKYTKASELTVGTRYLFTDEDGYFDESLSDEPFEATFVGGNTINYIENVNFTQSLYNGNGRWSAVDLPAEDIGSDLLGIKLTRGGTCVYTVTSSQKKSKKPVLDVTYNNGSSRTVFSVAHIRHKLADGSWKIVNEYTREQLTGMYVKNSIGRTLQFRFGYNTDVMRVEDSSGELLVVNTVERINEYIYKGTWTIIKAEPMQTDGVTVGDLISLPSADSQKSILINQEEKQTMSKSTNISVKVSTAPFAKTTVTTIFGEYIADLDEHGLRSALQRIACAKTNLKELDLGKVTAGSYQDRELKALTAARTAVIDALDALDA